jgi:kexin
MCTPGLPGVAVPTPVPPWTAITDPAYPQEAWYLSSINVSGVWEMGITGHGVQIIINDNGVDYTHPDLRDNFVMADSINDPMPYDDTPHGTYCAGLALAAKNSICGIGVAPDAKLAACNWEKGMYELGYQGPGDCLLGASNIQNNHISSNSWGLDACSYKPCTGEYQKYRGKSGDTCSSIAVHLGIKESTIWQADGSPCLNPIWEDERLYICADVGRRLLPAQCPFFSAASASPCMDTRCTNWLHVPSSCENVIVYYCLAEWAAHTDPGCAAYYDLFVSCEYNSLPAADTAALLNGVNLGRTGLGVIYTFASGNERAYGDDVNGEGWLSSIYTITVGAIGKDMQLSSYSSTGAAVFICAPGGDLDQATNMVTTGFGGTCEGKLLAIM